MALKKNLTLIYSSNDRLIFIVIGCKFGRILRESTSRRRVSGSSGEFGGGSGGGSSGGGFGGGRFSGSGAGGR